MTDSTPPLAESTLSVNALTQPLVQRLLDQAEALGVIVARDPSGVCIVDAGIQIGRAHV